VRPAARAGLAALALSLAVPGVAGEAADAAAPSWPAPTRESRPWTRWWWLGSAVDAAGLTRQLELFAQAGIGGVEICPIYGVQGLEDQEVAFLSPRWVALLGHTLREARRLGLGVDLTTGTGWPFGGPNVTAADASAKLVLQKQPVTAGARLALAPGVGRLVAVLALAADGTRVDLTARVAPDGSSDWIAPADGWQLYVARAQGPVQQVKRAAPGGEGNVLDPFSPEALGRYLVRFDGALAGLAGGAPRAQFHDSFEYYGASFTPELFDAFAARRGYDLRRELPALYGDGPAADASRVRADYRETLGELHLGYVRRWSDWSHAHGSLTRNQAHGGPGDLVDAYAAADIPETELFGRPDEKAQPRLKLAASAAHLAGRALASAEAFTWLGEHFQVSLADAKVAADWLFVSGVNHLFFHGIPWSPEGAEWPGWQFYASVNFGPQGGLWRDLPAFTAYLRRVQSVLQSGEPDEDVLVYESPRDAWHKGGDLVVQNPVPEAFDEVGRALSRRGYAWDAVSERFLAAARVERGRLRIGAGRYAAIVVPRTEQMSPAVRDGLDRLARAGVAVVFLDGPAGERVAQIDARLAGAGVAREAMADSGVWFVRRRDGAGRRYFVVNRGIAAARAWQPLGTRASSVVRLDPREADRVGALPLRRTANGATEVLLDLEPGESAVLQTLEEGAAAGPAWPRLGPAGPAIPLVGPWSVRFVEGGPVLPPGFETDALGSWTARGDEDARRFAGTARYAVTFERPSAPAAQWRLDLGAVAETARVSINGRPLGTLWSPPFSVLVGGALRTGPNTLELEVTNLAANRVRDLDRRGVRWKRFRDANVLGLDYKPLDASAWPLRDSGLLGPVTLQPLQPARD
jgi:hypothetical protein